MTYRILLGILVLWTSISSLSAQNLIIYGLQGTGTGTSPGALRLSQLDPLSGTLTPIYTLANSFGAALGTSTYDPIQKRYIFWGIDQQGNNRYYAAAVDSNSWIQPIANDAPPIELQFDLQSQKTYGLVGEQNRTYLVTLNEMTGKAQDSLFITNTKGIIVNSATFNSNHHRFIFMGVDNQNVDRLYYVDAQTGAIISSPAIPADKSYIFLQYDLTFNKLYALAQDRVSDPNGKGAIQTDSTWLVEIDTLTAQPTKLGAGPVFLGGNGYMLGSDDYDQDSHTMILVNVPQNDLALQLINTQTAQVIASTPFPNSFFELECDNLQFALKTYPQLATSVEAPDQSQPPMLFPNPASDRINLSIPEGYQATRWSISDATGRNLAQGAIRPGTPSVSIQLADLPAGLYWVRLEGETGVMTTLPVSKQ